MDTKIVGLFSGFVNSLLVDFTPYSSSVDGLVAKPRNCKQFNVTFVGHIKLLD